MVVDDDADVDVDPLAADVAAVVQSCLRWLLLLLDLTCLCVLVIVKIF